MTDNGTRNIIGFLLENQPLQCSFCAATVALQNKKTGGVLGVGFSGCRCLARVLLEAPLSPPDLGKKATAPKLDRGSGEGEFGTVREQEELEEDSMEELQEEEDLSSASEQETLKEEREEEAFRKRREQAEALSKQREEEETRRKQKIEEEALALRKFEEEEARKKLEEEEAREMEEIRRKLAAEKEEESMRNAIAEMNLSRKTWTGMKYSPTLYSGTLVHIVFRWTPIDFHVVCDEDNDLLAILQRELLERVSSGKLKKINGEPRPDDVVIAEYAGAYYRARVSNSNSVKCLLSFIDYGDIAFKKIEEIYEIPDDLYKTPICGLKVRLDGLESTNFNAKALLCDTVDASLYETAYFLELMEKIDMKDMYTRGILCDINTGQTLNDVVKTNLRNF